MAERLAPDGRPQFVAVAPDPDARLRECFAAVDRRVADQGGSVCYGWRIWEWPGVLIEGEFHAVWRTESGTLLDVAPTPDGECTILFLPDSARRYEGRPLNNVRVALTGDPIVAAFIAVCDAEFEILNRGTRAYHHGLIALKGAEAREIAAVQRRKADLGRKLSVARPPSRNAPCPCSSGRKFKKCCGA